MITQSSEVCIVYVKPTKELVHHKTGNDAPIYIVFPLQYFDFHLQHPGLSPVIQILFFSFKLVGIGVIDQVSKCMYLCRSRWGRQYAQYSVLNFE